jgi:anthranilate phosphoribosyltransferase
MSDALKPALATLASGEPLLSAAAECAFEIIIAGEATQAQIGAFLGAIAARGPSSIEIAAGARAMRKAMVPVPSSAPVIDVCGTGGDGAHSLNVSSAVAFVLAGAGVRVAKHGNRAMSSRSGAADVLEALGVTLSASPDQLTLALDSANVAFLFAQNHHPAMRHVAGARKELGFRTIFNVLGPLSNPAGAQRQLVGVYAARLVEPLAQALRDLGAERAIVVHGREGLDEISISGPTLAAELKNGDIRTFEITPEDADLMRAPADAIKGGDAPFNARALRALLEGKDDPYHDVVVLNAAAAFMVAGKAETLREGAALASDSLKSGKALAALKALINTTKAPA